VPRLYNRIYDKVLAQVEGSSAIAKRLFWTAYNYKKAAIEGGDLSGGRFAPFWDRLVFSKIRAKLGGTYIVSPFPYELSLLLRARVSKKDTERIPSVRCFLLICVIHARGIGPLVTRRVTTFFAGHVRLLSSGASPISPEVFTFLRICFGAAVVEGYGMTETACLISITPLGDPTSGHVGAPNPACEIKLADLPEMNYTNADEPYPRGEVRKERKKENTTRCAV